MAIDLRKNSDALNKAYQQIVDNNNDTNWIIFGYEGQTPALKVVETGDGGIEEMVDELSAGKMMYAYCRVKDPNTSLNKFVLVQWTGESVPENVKLKYTTHLRDMQAFLKAVHVTVTARTETDIDEDDIVKRVAKASGSNYSFHKEKARPDHEPSPTPVGTDYKRVRPDREINLNERDKFWSQTEKDEISRQKDNKVKMEEERKRLDEERKEREQRECRERDQRVAERMKEINVQKEAERKADAIKDKEEEKRKWAQVQKESSIDEEERGHRSDQMRRERVAEATKLTSSSTAKSRDFFKQKSVERPEISNRGPPPQRKLVHDFGNKDQEEQPARKEPIQLPRHQEEPPASPEPVIESQPEYEPEPPQQTSYHREPEPEVAAPPPSSGPVARDLMRQGLPPRQDSDPEEDQDWDEPSEDHAPQDHRVPSPTQQYPDVVESTAVPAEDSSPVEGGGGDQGLCARALYDYQAADDTEITFDPDDIITNIEQIDEGWWQGFSPDGSYGMFPANYVEIING